jgi:hypothetical protein
MCTKMQRSAISILMMLSLLRPRLNRLDFIIVHDGMILYDT